MSAPGMWKTADGQILSIKEMTQGHLKNSMRLMARRMHEATPNNKVYYERKLMQLGCEAQNRNLISNPIDFDDMIRIIDGWSASRDNNTYRPLSLPNVSTMPSVTQIAAQPPRVLSMHVDVCREVGRIIISRMPVKKKSEPAIRNITFEL